MDPLVPIVAGMAAILFGWIGYFLGNAFPVTAKAKQAKEKRKVLRDLEGRESPIKEATQKAIDWLLEREEDEVSATPDEISFSDEEKAEQARPVQGVSSEPRATPPQPASPTRVLIDTPKMVGEDAVILWHNGRQKKLFAKIGDDIFDLDTDLSQSQHGTLSMLLVDLQDRVGISAILRDAIEDGANKILAEQERKQRIPIEEDTLEKPSFNPIKSIVNYVRSDIPKLEDQKLSIPDQIDEIFQKNISGTHLENKGISVREWPNRGVVFIVGIDVYNDIHSIPDPEIRSEIRKAVKQWEAQQEQQD